MAIKILAQQPLPDNTFMLQLEGISSDTKPTDAFVATGSQFFEDDTDAVFSFNGSTWDLDKNGQMKDLPVVTSTDNGKILKVDNGVWSIGIDSGSSLPSMTGKNGKVLGVTLDAQDHEQAEWVTPSSGGGAEKFVVTLTQENDTWTADKTIAEIVAADAAGMIVECLYPSDSFSAKLQCIVAFSVPDSTVAAASFSGIVYDDTYDAVVVSGYSSGGSEQWGVMTTPIPTSSNAPLIVTMTEDQNTPGTYVGDKTLAEIHAAATAGRTVVFAVNIEGNEYVMYCTSSSVVVEGGNAVYQAYYNNNGDINHFDGGASDYPSLS